MGEIPSRENKFVEMPCDGISSGSPSLVSVEVSSKNVAICSNAVLCFCQ